MGSSVGMGWGKEGTEGGGIYVTMCVTTDNMPRVL